MRAVLAVIFILILICLIVSHLYGTFVSCTEQIVNTKQKHTPFCIELIRYINMLSSNSTKQYLRDLTDMMKKYNKSIVILGANDGKLYDEMYEFWGKTTFVLFEPVWETYVRLIQNINGNKMNSEKLIAINKAVLPKSRGHTGTMYGMSYNNVRKHNFPKQYIAMATFSARRILNYTQQNYPDKLKYLQGSRSILSNWTYRAVSINQILSLFKNVGFFQIDVEGLDVELVVDIIEEANHALDCYLIRWEDENIENTKQEHEKIKRASLNKNKLFGMGLWKTSIIVV